MTIDAYDGAAAAPAIAATLDIPDETMSLGATRKDYDDSLETFDVAVCEALAVSQASSSRIAVPHHGYGTHIFTCICGAAVALIRAAPLSRWTRSDFQNWALSGIAAHARAIIEGQLLFFYIMETPESTNAWSAKLNVMHLNDCVRRISLHTNIGSAEAVKGFEVQAEELRNRLRGNEYFLTLPQQIQKRCLDGDSPMIVSRNEMLDKMGWDRNHFRAIFDLLSQHAHILPLSFYRIEPNGRGSGLENPSDRGYISMMLLACADVLEKCTNEMVGAFPDTAAMRKGKKSRFSPGPRGNLPR
jgi:hypothetical protein